MPRRRLAAAVLFAVAALVLASAATPAQPGGRPLYFQYGKAIVAMDTGSGRLTKVVRLRAPAIDSIAVSDRYVFWVQESKPGATSLFGTLWRARRSDGRGARPIATHVLRYGGTTVIGPWLYWIDVRGLSRVGIDGRNVQRTFIPLTIAKTDVAEGIVNDGRYLYFSRCGEGAIGRVFPDGSDLRTRFIRAGRRACPQGLGIDAGHVYWTEDGAIGRANLDGSGVEDRWLRIGSELGPYYLASDGHTLFFNHGTSIAAGAHSYLGRVRTDGTHLRRILISDPSIGPLALAP